MKPLPELNLGLAVKVFRKRADTSQKKLADKVLVTITHISHIENNKADPSINLLRKIAAALGISLETLLLGALGKETP